MRKADLYPGRVVFWAGCSLKNDEVSLMVRSGEVIRVGAHTTVEAPDGQIFHKDPATLKASREEAQDALERMAQKLEEARR